MSDKPFGEGQQSPASTGVPFFKKNELEKNVDLTDDELKTDGLPAGSRPVSEQADAVVKGEVALETVSYTHL